MSEASQRNIPVPDELADVRARIKRLEEREAELKRIILTDPDTRTGADWIAVVKTVTAQRVNQQALKDLYPEVYEKILLPNSYTQVDIMAIDPDTGEIISARRKRKVGATHESSHHHRDTDCPGA